LQSTKSQTSGELKLSGLEKPVEVLYDEYGIPHIYAQNEHDLFMAFGYVHAQDRLFQMEIARRLADGRLSEVFGKDALESDKFFRTLGFRKYAEMTLDSVYRKNPNAPFVKGAEAYIAGVNQYIENGKTPIEFTLAGIPKTPYTLTDMEIIVAYMGFTFAEAFRTEAFMTDIQSRFGEAYLQDFTGNWQKNEPMIPVQLAINNKQLPVSSVGKATSPLIAHHSILNPQSSTLSIVQLLNRIEENLPYMPFHGSNGWVIGGSKTKSGKPILSNDTHMAFGQPSTWYEAHLSCPNFNFYGNFVAGTPFGALGHQEHGGWGITMFENDDVDFYREKQNPANQNQVWFKDHWEDLKMYTENIKIKDQADEKLVIKKSRHGILISEVEKNLKNSKEPIAMWRTLDYFPSRNIEAFYGLAHAHNAQEAQQAVAKIHAPGLNIMWGDTTGNIAWWAAAKLPIRPKHVRPYLILDGSTGTNEPTGWADFSKNPQILNPARGVLYTANNQPADMGNGLVPGYYVPADRAKRIEQLLFTDKKDWAEPELRKVINDVTSPTAVGILSDILPLIKASESNKKGYEMLKSWNGSHNLEDIAPTIYYRFLYRFYDFTMRDELGTESFKVFVNYHPFKRNMATFLRNDASPWWDNIQTPKKESRSEILTQAFETAMQDLNTQLGTNIETWKWENVHSLTHKHPLSIIPIVGKYFSVGPLNTMGGRETLNNLDFPIDSTGHYHVAYGPALRRIVDFGNMAAATGINPTGQSGNVMSKHYQDQAQMYVDGKARPEFTTRKDIENVQTGKLVFKP
jgi:penicillin amidase